MKKISLLLSMIVVLFMTSCNNNTQTRVKSPEVNITSAVNPADGLDFKLVGALLQNGTVNDAQGLERELNKTGGINNLDLNGDGSVDYVNVSENNGQPTVKSFDLTTGTEADPTFIGSVEVENVNGQYKIHMSGSEAIYGANSHYTSHVSTGNMLFYAWLFSPRPRYYHSPYYMGHYPSYYGGPRVIVSRGAYTSRTTTQRTSATKSVTKSKTPHKSKVKSANKGKTSKKARTSLSNNKKSQKSFGKRNTDKKVAKGGFNNKAKANKANKAKVNRNKSSKKPAARKKSKSSSSWGKSSRSSRSSRSSSSRSSSSRSRRSDINSKERIDSFSLGLAFMQQLQPKTYHYKKEWVANENLPSTKQYGLIAQEVEVNFPEFVETDSLGYKSVDYVMLVPVLIQANKELIRNMQMIEKRLLDLEKITAGE